MTGPAEIPFCPEPFTFLNRDSDRFFTCCPGWMHESRFIWDAGEIANLWDAWNHPKLVELRKAILQRDYRYCQRCPNRFRRRDRETPNADETPVMSRPPITYQCLDDHACNLRCPSCRDRQEHTPPKVWPLSRVVRDMPGIQTVALSLSGDPFASQDCRQFLATAGTPDVILWTNGLLLPRYWSTVRRRVTVLVMSIDAAEAQTYERLRHPGRWTDLVAAMDRVGELCRQQRILLWQTNFIVQADNWRQMPAFVEFCRGYGVHCVQFCLLAPWPHITPAHWAQANVCDPKHPDHAAFLRLLEDDRLRKPGVDMGLVTPESVAYYGAHHTDTDFWRGARI